VVLSMSRPFKHKKTGVYWFRRVVPEKLRPIIGRTEFKESLRTKDPNQARALYPAIARKYDAIIEQAKQGGPLTLSHQQVVALAGAWYTQRLKQDEQNPGDAEGLRSLAGDYNAMIVSGELAEGRKIVASEVDAVLRREGLLVDEKSRTRLADQMFELYTRMIWMLAKRAEGDYRPDSFAEGIPSFRKVAKVSFAVILAGWSKERAPRKKTVYDWDRYTRQLEGFIGHSDASQITDHDAIRWKNSLLDSKLSAKTINTRLTAIRSLFGWAIKNRLLTNNPFKDVTVERKRSAERPRLPFTDEIVQHLLLKASSANAPIKWMTWIQAYTGDRISSVSQLRTSDIKRVQGIWVLDFHADAAHDLETGEIISQKNIASVRTVPIHPAVIEAGLLEYVESLGDGPLFREVKPDRFGRRGGNMTKRYSGWLRKKAGVTDRRYVDHSWRHWFKDFCRNNGIPRDVHNRLTGHSLGGEGDNYGEGHSLKTLYDWICRLPKLGTSAEPTTKAA
jgi:integrase